ncbi:hypothetical protein IC232_08280 [Microvirga sp. BT688]|nr:hypothetical protein [Microvirga sp.]MBD2746695.1 hypothetical protein [Microvirga sp.]
MIITGAQLWIIATQELVGGIAIFPAKPTQHGRGDRCEGPRAGIGLCCRKGIRIGDVSVKVQRLTKARCDKLRNTPLDFKMARKCTRIKECVADAGLEIKERVFKILPRC